MVMTPEAWTVIGTGVVILIAIATSHRNLRTEMKAIRDELRAELTEKIDGLRGEMNEKMNGLHTRMDQIQADFGGLRERMAKLEGLLEGRARRSPDARPPDRRAGRRLRDQRIAIRLDADIAEHFRASGPGWQTRLNATLREALFGPAK